MLLKRVKAHASRREPSTYSCNIREILPISENKIQLMLQRICLFFFAMLPYAVLFLGFYIILEDRHYGLIYNLIEIFLLDGTKTTVNVTFNVTCDDLAFHQTWLRKRVSY